MIHPIKTLLYEVFVAPLLGLLLGPFMPGKDATPMENKNLHALKAGTILIRENALLPEDLHVESAPGDLGWRVVRNLDAYALDRKIRACGWTFFYLAEEITGMALGADGHKTAQAALQRILKKLKPQEFNSLQVTAVTPKRFLGIPYTTVIAHSRQIQETLFLIRASGLPEGDWKLFSGNKELITAKNGQRAIYGAADFKSLVFSEETSKWK